MPTELYPSFRIYSAFAVLPLVNLNLNFCAFSTKVFYKIRKMQNNWASHIWDSAKSTFSRKGYYQGISDGNELVERSGRSFPVLSTRSKENNNILDEDQETMLLNTQSSPNSDSRQRKWIKGVIICAAITGAVLTINVIATIAMAVVGRKYTGNGSGFQQISVVYRGKCATSKRWSIALHLIINILSTCILGASNYCMQTLLAPTREEVDTSHARGKWLHIGSASFKNLFAIGKDRQLLWFTLLITATPFHLVLVYACS